jgi:DNA-directed RNA polymerase subunit alpha
MYLRKQGPGAVTAADIAPPAGVEVHNPDLHIATLNGKGKLEMELTVERGRGYVSAVQNKQVGQEIGRIPIDSIYSPVLKVTYKVEATRVEQRTDFDRLIVDVETKSSMTPRDAMASPARRWSSCSAWPASSTSRPRASTWAPRRPTRRWPRTSPCRSRTSS